MAKWLIMGGFVLIFVGILVWLGLPLGRLPGDIHYKGEKTDIYFPITTSILISVVLSVVLWLISSRLR